MILICRNRTCNCSSVVELYDIVLSNKWCFASMLFVRYDFNDR